MTSKYLIKAYTCSTNYSLGYFLKFKDTIKSEGTIYLFSYKDEESILANGKYMLAITLKGRFIGRDKKFLERNL